MINVPATLLVSSVALLTFIKRLLCLCLRASMSLKLLANRIIFIGCLSDPVGLVSLMSCMLEICVMQPKHTRGATGCNIRRHGLMRRRHETSCRVLQWHFDWSVNTRCTYSRILAANHHFPPIRELHKYSACHVQPGKQANVLGWVRRLRQLGEQ